VGDAQYSTPANLDKRARLHAQFGHRNASDWSAVLDTLLSLDLPPEAQLVDVGGGHGNLWVETSDRIPAGWQITHTDLSPGMVAAANQRIGRVNSTFAIADVQALPFDTCCIDAVTALFVLYHVQDRARAYQEVSRILKVNGAFIVVLPSERMGAELRDLATRFNDTTQSRIEPWPQLSCSAETAELELAAHFHQVETQKNRTELRISEASPLADYLTSRGPVDERTYNTLCRFLDQAIKATGAISLHPETAIFLARKPT
jgi:ubiquinone/menaquinone biosynthesis C-methylase UbiE